MSDNREKIQDHHNTPPYANTSSVYVTANSLAHGIDNATASSNTNSYDNQPAAAAAACNLLAGCEDRLTHACFHHSAFTTAASVQVCCLLAY